MSHLIAIRQADPKKDRDFLKTMLRGLYQDQCIKEGFMPDPFADCVYKSLNMLVNALQTNNGVCLIAELDGQPAGFLCHTDTKMGGAFFIRPEGRRRGLGRALIQTFEESRNPSKQLEIEVLARNDEAIPLYEQFGYQADPARSNDRLLVMVKAPKTQALEASLA